MTLHPHSPSLLASTDPRPFVLTLVAAGWFVLYGLIGFNAVGSQIYTAYAPTTASHNEVPALDAREALANADRDERAEYRALLDRLLAAALAAISAGVFFSAIALLRRKSWSVAALWSMGALTIAASALYTAGLLKFDADQAAGAVGVEDAVTAVAAVAFLNVAIQSVPTLILMGLSRHPAIRDFIATPKSQDHTPKPL